MPTSSRPREGHVFGQHAQESIISADRSGRERNVRQRDYYRSSLNGNVVDDDASTISSFLVQGETSSFGADWPIL